MSAEGGQESEGGPVRFMDSLLSLFDDVQLFSAKQPLEHNAWWNAVSSFLLYMNSPSILPIFSFPLPYGKVYGTLLLQQRIQRVTEPCQLVMVFEQILEDMKGFREVVYRKETLEEEEEEEEEEKEQQVYEAQHEQQ